MANRSPSFGNVKLSGKGEKMKGGWWISLSSPYNTQLETDAGLGGLISEREGMLMLVLKVKGVFVFLSQFKHIQFNVIERNWG